MYENNVHFVDAIRNMMLNNYDAIEIDGYTTFTVWAEVWKESMDKYTLFLRYIPSTVNVVWPPSSSYI